MKVCLSKYSILIFIESILLELLILGSRKSKSKIFSFALEGCGLFGSIELEWPNKRQGLKGPKSWDVVEKIGDSSAK